MRCQPGFGLAPILRPSTATSEVATSRLRIHSPAGEFAIEDDDPEKDRACDSRSPHKPAVLSTTGRLPSDLRGLPRSCERPESVRPGRPDARRRRTGFHRGCVKTCTSEERAALFSLLSFPHSGRQCFLFFRLTKSRKIFYAQSQGRGFHTGSTHSRLPKNDRHPTET